MSSVERTDRSFLSPATWNPTEPASPAAGADWGRRSFRFMAAFTAGLVIPSLLLCATFAAAWVHSEQRRLIGDITAQTGRAVNRVDQFLSGQSAMLRGLGTSPALDLQHFVRFGEQVRSLYAEDKIDIVLRDRAGHTLFRTGTASDRPLPAVPPPGDGQPVLSDFIPGPGGVGGFVVLTVPVLQNGTLRYLLEAEIDSSAFAAVLERSGVGLERMASIADRQGRVIARNDARPKAGDTIAGFTERLGPEGIWTGYNPSGLEVRMAYQRIPWADWMVSVGMSEKAFRAPLIRSLEWLLGLTIVTILGTVGLLTPLVRQRVASQRAAFLAEERLRVSEERLGLALESGRDGLFDWNLAANQVWVSPHWFEGLGSDPELSDRSVRYCLRIIHPADRRDVIAHVRDHLQGRVSSMEIEYRCRCADGDDIWVLLRARIVERDDEGRPLRLVGNLMDITRRKEAELHVVHMAHHDALTGLPNRTLFQIRLSDALAKARPEPVCHAVLVCDLDRFKAVNDTFGHLQGDRLLCTVADRIGGALGPHDTLARLGGDEFGVFLDSVAGEAAVHEACKRILAAVAEPLSHQGRTIDIAISVGVVLVNDGTATADELFRQADMAMYQAKAAGRNTYRLLEAKVLARDSTRGWLALDMKEAIRRGDFFLVYQPVIDVATGAVLSFEALMRWQHPARGMISPADFIPVAEETGMIVQLGAWALEEACREATTWDPQLRVGVNVSPVQFRHGLEQAALAALDRTGLSPGRLKLEVTESVLMQDADGALACLHRLRDLGMRIALDDFGTGYSSLSYLRRFPFDKLKIDRSFIRDIDDPDTAAIIRAVVGIGQRLGMTIVAEGVETVQQLEAVRREGCNEVQGFLFSKPLPAAEARAFIATRPVRAA